MLHRHQRKEKKKKEKKKKKKKKKKCNNETTAARVRRSPSFCHLCNRPALAVLGRGVGVVVLVKQHFCRRGLAAGASAHEWRDAVLGGQSRRAGETAAARGRRRALTVSRGVAPTLSARLTEAVRSRSSSTHSKCPRAAHAYSGVCPWRAGGVHVRGRKQARV